MTLRALRIVVVLAALLASDASSTQGMTPEQASASRCKQVAQSVMSKLATGQDAAALELMRPIFPLPKQKFDETMKATLEQRRVAEAQLGKIVGIKLLREEKVSDFLLRLTYIEKRELNAVRWYFVFYKPANEWHMTSFYFDDKVGELFEPAGAGRP